MQLPFLPFEISPTLIILLALAFGLRWALKEREKAENPEEPVKPFKTRGPDMDFSAGRDAAQKGARFAQVFIPMEPGEEEVLRNFYLGVLGLTEMRAPNYPKDTDGFWAVSGTRQIYFGTKPSFAFDPAALPAFPIANLDRVAARLTEQGYPVRWNKDLSYVKRLVVTDPTGFQVGLIDG